MATIVKVDGLDCSEVKITGHKVYIVKEWNGGIKSKMTQVLAEHDFNDMDKIMNFYSAVPDLFTVLCLEIKKGDEGVQVSKEFVISLKPEDYKILEDALMGLVGEILGYQPKKAQSTK